MAEHAAAHPVSDAAEIERLQARVAALEAQPPKPQFDPESEAARQIKGYKTRIQNLNRKVQRLTELLEIRALVLPRKVSSAIDFVVQPDQRRNVTEERLDKACRLWNGFRDDLRMGGRVEDDA